jgi:glycosyltransferase involved in cell wall biosynthesis
MSNYDISIIITAHLRDKYLDKAFESVLAQDFDKKRTELIIVYKFDHDSDKLKTIKEKANIFGNFIDYQTSSDPLSFKIREGVETSKGNIICFLEDDDLFEPNKLKIVYKTFMETDNLGYFHNDHYIINEMGQVTYKSLINREKSTLIDGINSENFREQFLKIYQSGSPQFNLSSICMKRDLVLKDWLSRFTGRRATDVLLFLMAVNSSARIFLSHDRLTFYRVHSSQISLNQSHSSRYKRIMENYKLNEELLAEFEQIKKLPLSSVSKEILDLFFYLPAKIVRYGLSDKSRNVTIKDTVNYLVKLKEYVDLSSAVKATLFVLWLHYSRSIYIRLASAVVR